MNRRKRKTSAQPNAGIVRASDPPFDRKHAARLALGAVVLGGAIAVAYWQAVDAVLVYDDVSSITENRSITRLWPLWSRDDSPLNPSPFQPTSARPLVNLSLALNYHFGGLDPRGYHIVNVVLHFVAVLLLWAIVRRTLALGFFDQWLQKAAEPLAFAVALVWALHPLCSETVAYVTQRTEGLMAVCYLAVVYAGLRYWSAADSRGRAAWLVAAGAASVAGALSKEMIATAPAVMLLYERTFLGRSFRQAFKQSWPLYAAMALGWATLLVVYSRGVRTPEVGFGRGFPAIVWWCTQAEVLLLYCKLAVWPAPLSIHYDIPRLDTLAAAWPWVAAAATLLAASLVLAWRRTAAGFAMASAVIILSPTLVVPLVTEIAAERRMYLPLALIVALAVLGSYDLLARATQRLVKSDPPAEAALRLPLAVVLAGCLALSIVYIVVDNRRVSLYGDELTLWRDVESHFPNDAIAHTFEGILLRRAGHDEEALAHIERAVELDPNVFHAQYNLARYRASANRNEEAIAHCQEAIRINPNSVIAHHNLGVLLIKVGKKGKGIAELQEALRLDPNFVDSHNNLGVALASAGRPDAAIGHFQAVLRRAPNSSAHWNLALAYAQANRAAEGIAEAKQALALAREEQNAELAARIEAWLVTHPKNQ